MEGKGMNEVLEVLGKGDFSAFSKYSIPVIYDILDLQFHTSSEKIIEEINRSEELEYKSLFKAIFNSEDLRKQYDRYVSEIKLKELKEAIFSRDFTYMFFGGNAGEIGRSMLLMNINGRLVLVDAGIKPANLPFEMYPSFDILSELGEYIDAVFITHVHYDHVGSLPMLVRILPNAKFYMTASSKEIYPVILHDFLNVIDRRDQGVYLLFGDEFSKEDKEKFENFVISKISTLEYGKEYQFGEFSVKVLNSHHIYGSASFLFRTRSGLRILYSGDIGGDAEAEDADVLFLESTYGDMDHEPFEEVKERLKYDVLKALYTGKSVFIPAFALGRTQEILKIFRNELCRIYVGGLAYKVSKRIPETMDMNFDELTKDILENRRPKIVIASSNMLTGGISAEIAPAFIESDCLIAITGHQDGMLPGGKLLSQRNEPYINIEGATYKRKAQINYYDLSAHAGQSDLIRFGQKVGAKTIVLMHGGFVKIIPLSSLLVAKMPGVKIQTPEFQAVYSESGKIADLGNYWGIVSRSSIFTCYTCKKSFYGYRNAIFHEYNHEGHDIQRLNPEEGVNFFKVIFIIRDQNIIHPKPLLEDVKSKLEEGGFRYKLDQGEYFTRAGTFYVVRFGVYMKSVDRSTVQGFAEKLRKRFSMAVRERVNDFTTYRSQYMDLFVSEPVSFENASVQEYFYGGKESELNVVWFRNQYKNKFRLLSSSPVSLRVEKSDLLSDLSMLLFPSPFIYRVYREDGRSPRYKLEVSSAIFSDPEILKLLVTIVDLKLFYYNFINKTPLKMSGIEKEWPEVLEGYAYWIYKEFFMESSLIWKKLNFRVSDETIKAYAKLEYYSQKKGRDFVEEVFNEFKYPPLSVDRIEIDREGRKAVVYAKGESVEVPLPFN